VNRTLLRGGVTAAAIVAALAACQRASFSDLSDGSRSGREGVRGQERGDSGVPGKAPRVVFAETEHEFGEVDQGTKVSHVFKLRNQGAGVLHIKNVRGS